MTLKEKMVEIHPDKLVLTFGGGVRGCPDCYDELKGHYEINNEPDACTTNCDTCWNQPYIEKENEMIDLSRLTPEQLEAIQKQVAEFERVNEKPKEWVSVREKYYEISGFENVFAGYKTESVSRDCGLIFKTPEEAEAKRKYLEIQHRLEMWAEMCDGKVDWRNTDKAKYLITFNVSTNRIMVAHNYEYKTNNVYFDDNLILEKAIEDIGEDNLKKYYFRVED